MTSQSSICAFWLWPGGNLVNDDHLIVAELRPDNQACVSKRRVRLSGSLSTYQRIEKHSRFSTKFRFPKICKRCRREEWQSRAECLPFGDPHNQARPIELLEQWDDVYVSQREANCASSALRAGNFWLEDPSVSSLFWFEIRN
jgi:hypothetical protein